jgi:hypothetical protein
MSSLETSGKITLYLEDGPVKDALVKMSRGRQENLRRWVELGYAADKAGLRTDDEGRLQLPMAVPLTPISSAMQAPSPVPTASPVKPTPSSPVLKKDDGGNTSGNAKTPLMSNLGKL